MLKALLNIYLNENPERLNDNEKLRLTKALEDYIVSCGVSRLISDDLYDFFVFGKIVAGLSRHERFGKLIKEAYPVQKYKNVLDVGAGRMCHLSKFLANENYNVTAIDKNIRLTKTETESANFRIIKDFFYCDSKNKIGTDITKYDLIVGLGPCDAAEHIIRQCLKYNKPFMVLLCAEPHRGLDGKKFSTLTQWLSHLSSISPHFKIKETNNSFFATNFGMSKPPNEKNKAL